MQTSTPQTEEDFKRLALKNAGIVYSATAVFPLAFSALLLLIVAAIGIENYQNEDWYKYFNYLIPQVCFAGIAVAFFRKSKAPVRMVYGGCKWYYFVIALILQFGLLFSLSELNAYFIKLLSLMGYRPSESTLPSLDGWNLLPAILVIAVLPALFEETVFRGIIARQMHENGWGTLTVCAHFANNAVILILESTGNGSLSALPRGGYLALVIVSALCLAGMLAYLVFFDRRNHQKGHIKHARLFLFAAATGIGVCAVGWLATLIGGFL